MVFPKSAHPPTHCESKKLVISSLLRPGETRPASDPFVVKCNERRSVRHRLLLHDVSTSDGISTWCGRQLMRAPRDRRRPLRKHSSSRPDPTHVRHLQLFTALSSVMATSLAYMQQGRSQ
jgi:hypothetical protein